MFLINRRILSTMRLEEIRFFHFFIACAILRLQIALLFSDTHVNSHQQFLRPLIRLGAPSKPVNGEHISTAFYTTAEKVETAKNGLQSALQNFLENLQKNLTTSSVLKLNENALEVESTEQLMKRINSVLNCFEYVSNNVSDFENKSEHFFGAIRNESSSLLLKLRHLPTAHHFLPRVIKLHLTNYFAEMEYLHVMLSTVMDEAIDYVTNTLRGIKQTFTEFADTERNVLAFLRTDEYCCERFMEYLEQVSTDVFKCASGSKLNTVYDVYAITAVTSKYILHELEFRIQRIFNCFLFGSYELRCRFMHNAEQDFEKLFAKLDELQIFYDIRTKKGRVSKFRFRNEREEEALQIYGNWNIEKMEEDPSEEDKCIPHGSSNADMTNDLKACLAE